MANRVHQAKAEDKDHPALLDQPDQQDSPEDPEMLDPQDRQDNPESEGAKGENTKNSNLFLPSSPSISVFPRPDPKDHPETLGAPDSPEGPADLDNPVAKDPPAQPDLLANPEAPDNPEALDSPVQTVNLATMEPIVLAHHAQASLLVVPVSRPRGGRNIKPKTVERRKKNDEFWWINIVGGAFLHLIFHFWTIILANQSGQIQLKK
jgi:hypothetical protein